MVSKVRAAGGHPRRPVYCGLWGRCPAVAIAVEVSRVGFDHDGGACGRRDAGPDYAVRPGDFVGSSCRWRSRWRIGGRLGGLGGCDASTTS